MTVVVLDQMRQVTVTQSSPSTLVTVAQAGMQGPQGNPTTVNGHTGASITLTAADVGALATTTRGAVNGVAELDSSGLVPVAELPLTTLAGSFVDQSTSQTIATGVKTFGVSPIVPTPTTSTQVANKAYADLMLPLTGGALSGALAMGAHKITGLANGTVATDAAAFGQIPTSAGGLGGLLAANNLTDVVNATTSRGSLSAAKSGANSDITSLGGLTTPITFAQGGTNKTSAPGISNQLLTTSTSAFGWFVEAYNVMAYGATGNGSTDDTATCQAAINACQAAGGGVVYFPTGTYLTTPTGSPLVGLSLKTSGSAGMQGVNLVGASQVGTVVKKNATGTLIQMSGPSSSPGTGTSHTTYCSVQNMTLQGNGLAGNLLQLYYVHALLFRDLHLVNNLDVAIDFAETWDCRFDNVVTESCGSHTANTTAPNWWIRASANTSGNFGYSTDVTNQIYITQCRWESFTSGAVRIEPGLGGAPAVPYGVYMTQVKMETNFLNGGNHLFVGTSRDVQVKQAYFYCGGFFSGYSTAQDMINFQPQWGTLDDVYIYNSTATAVIANGVTVGSPTTGRAVCLRNVKGAYTTAPTGAHINFTSTQNGNITVSGPDTDNGTLFAGTIPSTVISTVAPVTVTTSTATNLYQASFPPNDPKIGTTYRLSGFGSFTTSTAAATMVFKVFWGATTLTSTGTFAYTTTAASWAFKYNVLITFVTATTCVCSLELFFQNNAIGASSSLILGNSSPTTVTVSATNFVSVNFQWGGSGFTSLVHLAGTAERVCVEAS